MRAKTIAISLAVHAAALAVVSRCVVEELPGDLSTWRAVAIDVIPMRAPMGPTPSFEVALLTDDLPAIEHAAVLHARDHTTTPRDAHTLSDPPVSPGTAHVRRSWTNGDMRSLADPPVLPHDRVGAHEPEPSLLAMRGRRQDLALSHEVADRIAGGQAQSSAEGATVEEPRWAHDSTIKLAPDGAGHVVRDGVATVAVAPDGTVRVSDARDLTIRVNVPSPGKLLRRIARDLTTWYAEPDRDAKVGRTQDLPNHLRAVPGECDSFYATMCVTADDQSKMQNTEGEGLAGNVLISGTIDLTGYLHRKFVGDPHASRKLKILDQTRDERARLGEQFRRDQSRRSAELMQRNLDALLRATSDPAARRVAALALFHECDDDDAGRRARGTVIGWIRAHLPTAFTLEELADLERRSAR